VTRRVSRNVLWNVGGTLASIGVGLLAMPLLLHAMGTARLGVFTLALGLIGFSGLFDFGLGRALTQGVASALGQGRPRAAVAALVWHVLKYLALFGAFWGVALWLSAPFLVLHAFSLKGELATETMFGLRAMALSLPFTIVATGTMGALEGLQCFREVSTRRAALSILQFGLPTAIALINPNVGWVIAAMAMSRVLGLAVWQRLLHRVLPKNKEDAVERSDLHQLLRFGGWLSISNLIGPLMVYADRFYLATIFPPASVAYYTVPNDALTRASGLPNTAISAVFPALAEAKGDAKRTEKLLRKSAFILHVMILPPVVFGMIFAFPILKLWLGAGFAEQAKEIFQILLIGIFFNSCAFLPFAFLQSKGRSDLTAKIHLIELPLFAMALYWATHKYGVNGAALAWTMRVALDAALLYIGAASLDVQQKPHILKTMVVTMAMGAVISTAIYLINQHSCIAYRY
jgi:O-antigen/teichoic acid export membrane protein